MAEVKIDQKQWEALQEQIASMGATIAELNTRVKDAESKIPNMASTIEEIEKRNRAAERAPKLVTLKRISGYKKDKETGEVQEIPLEEGQFKENACPFCNKDKKKSIQDLTPSGRWACRVCGKHWYEEALNQPYSKALESFIKVGDEDVDPVNIFRNKSDGAEVSKLRAELDELKNLIIKASLTPKIEKAEKVA